MLLNLHLRSIKMKKLTLLTLLAAAIIALAAPSAQAATVSSTFNVNITLNTTCLVSSIPNIALSYTSFQLGASSGSSSYTVTCTNSLPYTMAVGAASVTDDALNLTYSVTPSAASGTGNGAAQTHSVAVSIAAGQSGTCAAASCANTAATNKLQTLTVTF